MILESAHVRAIDYNYKISINMDKFLIEIILTFFSCCAYIHAQGENLRYLKQVSPGELASKPQ